MDFVQIAADMSRREYQTIDEAIRACAEQCGMTPENWLGLYGVEVSRRYEGTKIISTVRATTAAGTIVHKPLIFDDF
jgi:hypothetical protein